jgi:hypothetical protein
VLTTQISFFSAEFGPRSLIAAAGEMFWAQLLRAGNWLISVSGRAGEQAAAAAMVWLAAWHWNSPTPSRKALSLIVEHACGVVRLSRWRQLLAERASTKNTAAHQKQLQISLYVLGGEMRRRQTVADIIDYPRGRPILGAMGNCSPQNGKLGIEYYLRRLLTGKRKHLTSFMSIGSLLLLPLVVPLVFNCSN